MATPLYQFLKQNGITTYSFVSSAQDIANSFQNTNFTMDFSKFVLLNLNLANMNMDNPAEFSTESTQTYTDLGELLVNSLRNYVANEEVVIKQSLLNNNTYFYDPTTPQTVTERVFWKWLRKTGIIQFEPAQPNIQYVDSSEFAVDTTLPTDYFKEYLWTERSTIAYNITDIENQGIQLNDPTNNNIPSNVYKVILGSSTNIKPNDTVNISNTGTINIGFNGTQTFYVSDVQTDPLSTNTNKNNWVFILSTTTITYNNFAVASLALNYTRVVQYIGEITNTNNAQVADSSSKQVLAYIPDQNGQTPDILFRLTYDDNYGPNNQYPILPSQEQPEIIGGEIYNSPLVLNPSAYPGDQYAYFDSDQLYINSDGDSLRRSGDYFGVLDNNRNDQRVIQTPYVYPEFDGVNLDGISLDFDPSHYTKMNIPTQPSANFDEFDSQSFNGVAPSDFEFNVILWYYDVEDMLANSTSSIIANTTSTTASSPDNIATNLYAITFLNPVVNNTLATYPKTVANGNQDGISYQFQLNLNFNVNSDNVISSYDPNKTYNMFGFNLFNKATNLLMQTNDNFLQLVTNITTFQTDLNNLKNAIYTQTDINNINNRIDQLNQLLNLYQYNQLTSSGSISVNVDQTVTPNLIYLESTDPRFGYTVKLPASILYNTNNNTALNFKVNVPAGKDFLINVINDDTSNIQLDKALNIVLSSDLQYMQSCILNIYPNNAQYNKNLNISIVSNLIQDIDTNAGYPLVTAINLPIDSNLNANVQTLGIPYRWNNIHRSFIPNNVYIKKVSNNYFLTLELDNIHITSFQTGDVLLIENASMTYLTSTIDVSGQYEVIGAITNNQLNFQINLQSFADFFKVVNTAQNNVSTQYLMNPYFTQPISFRYNNGYKITITNIDNVSKIITDVYLIEIETIKN